jgi:hypothetical protein
MKINCQATKLLPHVHPADRKKSILNSAFSLPGWKRIFRVISWRIAVRSRNRVAGAVLASLALMLSIAHSQIIIKNFAGVNLTDVDGLGTGGTPPDTMGAAGTNQFVEFINGGFAVYDKAGGRQSLISDIQFWENAGISSATLANGLTDTRIIYDGGSGRWFASELTTDFTANRVLVARSDSSNPSGPWKAVNFLANAGVGDFDTLGVDSAGVYVGVNNFDFRGNFIGVSFFSIPKADLLAATPKTNNMTRFDNLNDQVYGFALQGVCNPSSGPGHGVIIAIDNVGYNYLDRTTINNPGAAVATLGTTVRISNIYDGGPLPAAQPGGGTVDTGDDRFSGMVRQSGPNIYMANTVPQGGRDAVHWLVLNETNNAILGEGVFSDPNYDFYYPSIAPNSQGQFLLAFNRSGSTAPGGNIGIYGAVGSVNGSTVTMGPAFLIQTGAVSNFSLSFDSPPYRWGDYSSTMADPTDDNLFWTIQEIPASSTSWGTQITLISLTTNQPSLTISAAGSTVTLSWPLSTDPAYILQTSTNLASATAWSSVTNAPVISINQNLVTLTVTNGPAFYRLKK